MARSQTLPDARHTPVVDCQLQAFEERQDDRRFELLERLDPCDRQVQ